MGSNDGDGRTMNPRTAHDRTAGRSFNRATGRAWMRWVPAVAAPAVIAAGVLAGTIPARAGDPLPDKTPAEVIALLGAHKAQAFSGTVEQDSELGLPELPKTGPTSGPASADGVASVIEFLTGEHTARVYMDGATKARIQVVDRLAERDVIRRDSDVWFYSSKDNSAAHLTLPAHARDLPLADPHLTDPPLNDGTGKDKFVPSTPQELADKFLAAADSSTAVSVGPDVEAAGRSAYSLVLEPRTAGTLVGKVAIAVDAASGMPLSVEVTARGAAQPAFRAGFTSLSLEVPDAALFNFVPPPGSSVKELQFRDTHNGPLGSGFSGKPGMQATPEDVVKSIHDKARTYLTGTGWETVAELPAAAGAGSTAGSLLDRNPLLAQAAVAVPGGRLLSTALFNVLLTDDGRIFAGMVPPERLQAASAAP
jgi:outer membrane lipoprotein-sorting protein